MRNGCCAKVPLSKGGSAGGAGVVSRAWNLNGRWWQQAGYDVLTKGIRNFQDNPLTPFAKGELFLSQKLGDHLSLHIGQPEISAHVAIG